MKHETKTADIRSLLSASTAENTRKNALTARPSINIEPMLALIAAEGDLCFANYYRSAYPSEWRKSRRLDRVNTWRDDTGTEYVSLGRQM
jgi:hypothetical protein